MVLPFISFAILGPIPKSLFPHIKDGVMIFLFI